MESTFAMYSLGGGGMASLNIDPQGKSYAQQLLEHQYLYLEKFMRRLIIERIK